MCPFLLFEPTFQGCFVSLYLHFTARIFILPLPLYIHPYNYVPLSVFINRHLMHPPPPLTVSLCTIHPSFPHINTQTGASAFTQFYDYFTQSSHAKLVKNATIRYTPTALCLTFLLYNAKEKGYICILYKPKKNP